MKKRLLILTLVLVCLSCLFVVSLAAEEDSTTPNLELTYTNLSFNDAVYIKYAVSAENITPDDVRLLVWTEPQSDYTDTSNATVLMPLYLDEIDGAEYIVFDYTDLAAKQMTDVVYARAYAVVDGVDYYSAVNKYSILQYAQNKLATSTDAKLKALLSNMLDYGATAQEYFGYNVDRLPTATWYQIKVTAGTLDDGNTSGLYLPGDKVTLIVPEADAEGKVFSCWVDESGNEVATTATYELTVGTTNATYTPVYVKPQTGSVGLSFQSNGDGTCYVSGIGSCTDTDVIIPTKSSAGDTVTSIGSRAFSSCSGLTF